MDLIIQHIAQLLTLAGPSCLRKKACLIIAMAAVAGTLMATGQPRTTLSVMDFTYSDIPAPEATLLSDALLSEIANTRVFDVVERSRRDEILREQGFAQTGACNETSCLIEAGQMLAVQKMVGGSFGKIGANWAINIRVVDVRTGRVEKAINKYYKGTVDQLLLNMRENAQEIALITGVTPEVLKAQPRPKTGPVLFGRFRGTRMRYPLPTYAAAGLGVLAAVAAFYYNDGANSAYDEYLAATADEEILRYKSLAQHKDTRSNQATIGSAACIALAAVGLLVRVRAQAKPIMGSVTPVLATPLACDGRDGRYAVCVSVRF